MKRRDFITLAGGAAAWPVVGRAQQAKMPVVAFLRVGTAEANASNVAAFRKGLNETGFIEGRNVQIEYHWLDGQYDGLPALINDLIRQQVAVIATPASVVAALAAKTATGTIPIVFGVPQDPVQIGLVASLARPGGNATGFNFFDAELVAKRLRLLHDFVPKAVRFGVIVNPANVANTESTLREVRKAALILGLEIRVFNASTIGEIDAAFVNLARERTDALFVAPDAFLQGRRVQFATLTASYKIPAVHPQRESVAAGGLMSYGTDLADMFRHVGDYTGRILKGDKPADLPVQQSTKFEFVINMSTVRALRIEVPPQLLTIADEVIE